MFSGVAKVQAQNETVYFLVAETRPFHNDCYVLPLSEASAIEHARDLIQFGPGIGEAIVGADYLWGWPEFSINVNRNYLQPGALAWSWYVTEFIGFADVTAEILDGWPTGVEEGLVHPPSLGFWCYTVVAELGTDLEPWFCDLDTSGDVRLYEREVGFSDLAWFTSHWLESGCCHRYWCGGADLDASGTVELYDFAIFARNWRWTQPK